MNNVLKANGHKSDNKIKWKTFSIPFKDIYGDFLEFYYRFENNKLLLTDDGETFFNLKCQGIDINSKDNKEFLLNILKKNNIIKSDKDALIMTCSNQGLYESVNKFIYGLIILNNIKIAKSQKTIISDKDQNKVEECVSKLVKNFK